MRPTSKPQQTASPADTLCRLLPLEDSSSNSSYSSSSSSKHLAGVMRQLSSVSPPKSLLSAFVCKDAERENLGTVVRGSRRGPEALLHAQQQDAKRPAKARLSAALLLLLLLRRRSDNRRRGDGTQGKKEKKGRLDALLLRRPLQANARKLAFALNMHRDIDETAKINAEKER
ncbi:hypothetical protein Emag_003577 [Eimeria magna]